MRCYALCYRSSRIVIRRATTRPNGCLTFCVASTSDMLSLAWSELGKTCLWVRYSKTTRNRIDLLISLLSTTVRYLLSVWLDTTQTEAVHRKMTVLASTGRLLKKFSVMLIAIGCHALSHLRERWAWTPTWLNVERLGLYRRPMAGTCEGSDTADDTRPHYRRMGEILIWQCPSPVKLIVLLGRRSNLLSRVCASNTLVRSQLRSFWRLHLVTISRVPPIILAKAAFIMAKTWTCSRLIVTRWSLQNDLSWLLTRVFEAHTLLSRLLLRPNKTINFTGEGHCHIRISPILR